MKSYLLPLLAACSFSPSALAETLLFTGQVQSITIQPSGVGLCAPPCGWPEKAPKNGIQTVCITNQGACQNASIKVLTDHLGRSDGQVKEFGSRTGEWGGYKFPLKAEPILVIARDGASTWLPLIERDGITYVEEQEGQRPLNEFIRDFLQATPLRPNSR
ncbi:hypothetical protein [Pseudoduganella sp. OTU4001]|uniref:hypothetical protein n=1 Tax=Pseudoduganella sp. OTU4001 TaxID=3043854 RepID=UPI00313C1A1F